MPSRRVLRAVTAPVVALVAAVALAGCQVHTGTAAFVGPDRVSEKQVESYVGTPSSSPAQAGQLTPPQQVVSVLVLTQLLEHYLRDTSGGLPGDVTLDANREAAFEKITGQAAPDQEQLRAAIVKAGYAPGFTELYERSVELEDAVVDRSGAANLADLGKAVSAHSPAVKLSPRYGRWDAAQLAVDGSATPSYLKLSTPSPAAAPA